MPHSDTFDNTFKSTLQIMKLTQYDKFSATILMMNFHRHTIFRCHIYKRTTPIMVGSIFIIFLYDEKF